MIVNISFIIRFYRFRPTKKGQKDFKNHEKVIFFKKKCKIFQKYFAQIKN